MQLAVLNFTTRELRISFQKLKFEHNDQKSSREVIKQKDDILEGIGVPDWQLTIFLFFAWVTVYVVIIKGVKSSGKFSYFLAIFPYIVMLALLIRAVTLDGAWNGIKYFISPDFKRLLEPQVVKPKYAKIL